MKLKKGKYKIILLFSGIFLLMCLSSFIFEDIVNIESDLYSWDEGKEIEFLDNMPNIQATYQEEWLDNPSFNSPIDPWYNSTEGDTSDVNASAIPGEARFEVLGDSGNFSSTIEEPSYLNSSGDWISTNNPQFPVLPILLDEFGGNSYDPDRQSYGTDSTDGLWCAHDYDNNVGNGRVYNTPSIHFKKNYSIGKDLSDYQITSVTLNAVVNGTVCATRPQGGGVEVPGDEQGGGWEYEVYDYARYYVIVSDPDGITKHEMAYYRTTQLGDDDDSYTTPDGEFDSLDPTPLVTFEEDILIAFLTNVFETSSNKFTITLGIDIYCETNSDPDYDHWRRLNFEQFNFSFTYEKKISRYAGVAWNQVGDKINGTKYQIDEALLNFEYKSDDDWPTADSPNSEIIVQINNRTHTEVIKLSKINSIWQEAKTGGFDVTSLVRTNENISVSIKLMLMDNFELNETYTISIDNASLYITYSTAVGGEDTDYELYLNGEDETLSRAIEIKYNEIVNVSFVYLDSSTAFISGADVEITIDSDVKTLTENTTLEHYYILINTTTLHLGENFLSLVALKTGYDSQEFSIKIEVLPLDTDLQLFLDGENRTLEKSAEVIYGKSLNITVLYSNIEEIPGEHISNATVELLGYGSAKNLTENVTLEHYNITINSTQLGLGITYLTINAEKENFTTQNIVFQIEVVERETYLDNIFINNIETLTYEVPWNELFNITVSYNDSLTNTFISNATVKVQGTGFLENFSESVGNDYYIVWLNSSDLKVGIKYLTISAIKENYSIATQVITITTNEKDTEMDIYLNQTMQTLIDIYWNENLNVTILYKDLESSAFIDNATVELREGSTVLFNFSEQLALSQYNLTLNTSILDMGVNALIIYAKKENYSVALGSITINVFERETDIDIFLNQTQSVLIEIPYGEPLNITIRYRDVETSNYISGATVSLKDGAMTLHNFDEHSSLNQYNLTLDTTELGVGVHALTIYAKQDNYSAALGNIIINIVERETELEIFLNETLTLSIEVPWGDLLNITVVYRDLDSSAFLSGATVTLKNATKVLFNFDEQSQFNQYNLTVNTTIFGVGVNALTVFADKDNYSVSLESITINVVERETTIEVFLNQTPSISIEIPYDEILNITAVYENLGVFISEANVTLKEGNTVLYNFTEQPLLYQYNLSINTTDFGVGVRALTVYASKENYTVSLQGITVSITSRGTYSVILLNNEDKTIDKSTTLTNGQLLNITIVYRDTITDNFIEGGSVRVLKGLEWDKSLDENSVLNHYNITLNSTIDLGAGIVFLTIIAENTNYQTYTASLTIFIIDRGTYYNLTIDGQDKTNDPSIERNVNETISIRVFYKDNLTDSHIKNASVRLIQGGTETNLTENATDGYYNISINTLILDQGFNFLTIYAYKEGYIAQQILITVEIIERETALELILNGTPKTTEPTLKITIGYHLNITVRYYDNITKGHIENATVQLLGDYIDNLTEYKTLQQYTLIIDTFDLPSTINFLTIYAYKSNFEPISLLATIEIITRNTTSKLFLNSQDKTIDRFLNITYGGSINITITYRDVKSIPDVHIVGATVKLIGLGADKFLTENSTFEHYSIIISTTDLQLGSNIFTIECNKSNYLTKSYTNINIFIEERKTGLQLFLNQIDKTTELDISLPIGTNFVITVKYYDLETEDHISGANVQLEGDLTTILTENVNLKQFSYTGNTNALDIGISIFSIVAQKSNYETNTIKFKINVERIKTEINTTAGKKLFELLPGESFKLEIVLKDLDFGGNITNASVRYSWQYGEGDLEDLDGDGIYEATLVGIPQGTFTITITVFAGDDYRFERFEVTLSAYTSEEANWLFLALFLIVLVSGLVVSIYTAAYQTYLKYPKPVRKVRKFKKKLKKGKAPEVAIISRKEAYKKNFNEEFSKRSKYIKRLIPDEKERELLKASTEKLALMAPIPVVIAGGLKYKGNEVGVLLIHGGGEDSATEFKELADHLAKTGGYTIRIPFLSEYGSTPENFLSIRNEDLVNELETELAGLKEKSKIVIVGGHSLGGILALYLSAKMNPDLIFTINAPSSIEEFKSESLPIFKVFKDDHPLYKDELQRIAEGDVKDIDRTPLKMASKIIELINTSKKSLKDVRSPTLLLQGRKDNVIKSSSIEDIYRVIKSEPKKKVWLENSTHSLIDNPDKETLFSEISNFINETLEKKAPKKKSTKESEAKPKEKPKEKVKSVPKKEPKPEPKKEPEFGPKPKTKELPKKELKSQPASFTTIIPPKIELKQSPKEKPKKEPETEPKKESKAKTKEEQKKETKSTAKEEPKEKSKEEPKAEPAKESKTAPKKSNKKSTKSTNKSGK